MLQVNDNQTTLEKVKAYIENQAGLDQLRPV